LEVHIASYLFWHLQYGTQLKKSVRMNTSWIFIEFSCNINGPSSLRIIMVSNINLESTEIDTEVWYVSLPLLFLVTKTLEAS
jgi:hypothetical protein